MQGNMTQLSCFFVIVLTTCMFVRMRFTIPFLISYIQLHVHSFFFLFFFSLFPFFLFIQIHVCIYVDR